MRFRSGLLSILTVFSFMIGCSSGWKISDRMEGIQKGILRVYVRVENSAEIEADKTGDELRKRIIGIAVKRAEYLAGSHWAARLGATMPEGSIREVINFKSPIIAHQECMEEYCEAFVDFDAKALAEKLRSGK